MPRVADTERSPLRHALEAAFAHAHESDDAKAAIRAVGALLENDPSADAIEIVMQALAVNVAQDLVAANILYEVFANCEPWDPPAHTLIRLAEEAHAVRACETLASILSILANRPWRLVDVKKEWIDAALDADVRAGHDCRAATLSEISLAWPSPERLAAFHKKCLCAAGAC